jgi:antitoxin component of MazEF toxin-antitoxin module
LQDFQLSSHRPVQKVFHALDLDASLLPKRRLLGLTITKIGNSHGIIFDSTLLQLAHLKPGDEVNVEVHAGGMITIAPLTPTKISSENATATAKRLIGKNEELFRRLS